MKIEVDDGLVPVVAAACRRLATQLRHDEYRALAQRVDQLADDLMNNADPRYRAERVRTQTRERVRRWKARQRAARAEDQPERVA